MVVFDEVKEILTKINCVNIRITDLHNNSTQQWQNSMQTAFRFACCFYSIGWALLSQERALKVTHIVKIKARIEAGYVDIRFSVSD